jgi:hypothetical protein
MARASGCGVPRAHPHGRMGCMRMGAGPSGGPHVGAVSSCGGGRGYVIRRGGRQCMRRGRACPGAQQASPEGPVVGAAARAGVDLGWCGTRQQRMMQERGSAAGAGPLGRGAAAAALVNRWCESTKACGRRANGPPAAQASSWPKLSAPRGSLIRCHPIQWGWGAPLNAAGNRPKSAAGMIRCVMWGPCRGPSPCTSI